MKIEEPKYCPYCGATVVRILDDGANVYCSNTNCPGRNLEKLKYFVSKECMDIDGISGKTLEKLLDSTTYNIRNWWDLYGMSKESFMNIGLGKKTSAKLVDELNKSKTANADKVLMALSIPMIGKVNASKLLERFASINNIEYIACSPQSNMIRSEIGDVAGQYVIDYMIANHNLENGELSYVYKLLNTVYEADTPAVSTSDRLSGLTVLATGTFDNFSRDGIKESIVANGAKYASGVNKKLSILVVGKEAGPSKLAKAKELGIKMISEQEYMDMIELAPSGSAAQESEHKTEALSLF